MKSNVGFGDPTKKKLRFSRQSGSGGSENLGGESVLSARGELGSEGAKELREGEGPGVFDEPIRDRGSRGGTTEWGSGFSEPAV